MSAANELPEVARVAPQLATSTAGSEMIFELMCTMRYAPAEARSRPARATGTTRHGGHLGATLE